MFLVRWAYLWSAPKEPKLKSCKSGCTYGPACSASKFDSWPHVAELIEVEREIDLWTAARCFCWSFPTSESATFIAARPSWTSLTSCSDISGLDNYSKSISKVNGNGMKEGKRTLSYVCRAEIIRSLVSINVPIISSFSTSYTVKWVCRSIGFKNDEFLPERNEQSVCARVLCSQDILVLENWWLRYRALDLQANGAQQLDQLGGW